MDEYEIENIRDIMNETAQVPENIYFFYGGDSEQFVNALEFIGLNPINREFSAFLLSDLGRKTMTQNKLSIHVETDDIFYDNHSTGENFHNKMMRRHMFLKRFLTEIVLRLILALFFRVFLSTIKKSLIFLPLKI